MQKSVQNLVLVRGVSGK